MTRRRKLGGRHGRYAFQVKGTRTKALRQEQKLDLLEGWPPCLEQCTKERVGGSEVREVRQEHAGLCGPWDEMEGHQRDTTQPRANVRGS